MKATRLTYIGPASDVGDLAQEFADHGLSFNYEPPLEPKDLGTALAATSVLFAVTGSTPDLIAAVEAFTARHHDVRIEGLPLSPAKIQVRFAEFELLHGNGVVDDDEA